ncbi:MAG: PIN domain-containing protein [Gemmatimonadota bacterium]|nr:PIN domain-containing protein [Gemmatimonadota bacterium]
MIAIDTNVVLHYLLRDDEAQAERARRVIEGGERVLITDVVLAETVWTLAGRRYRATRAE